MLEDESFPPEEFVSTEGLLSVKWDRVNSYPYYSLGMGALYRRLVPLSSVVMLYK